MRPPDLNASTVDEYVQRLESLTPATSPQWGKLTPHRLLAHLRFMFEMSLGERTEPLMLNPPLRWLFYRLFFCWFTQWPKGRIKAPANFTPAPAGGFDSDRAEVIEMLRRFVELSEREPDRCAVSPALGSVTLRQWQRVHGVHLSHHLRQFGL